MNVPAWAAEAIALYESNAASQFVLYGNVNDRLLVPAEPAPALGDLNDFLIRVLMPRFDVVLSYDLGNGIRVEKGGEVFQQWPTLRDNPQLPKAPRAAVETLTHYFRYAANLARAGRGRAQVGCIIRAAHLLAPSIPGLNYDLSALALLMRDWSADPLLTGHTLATFLITENLHDLHPLLVNNPRAAALKVPLPDTDDIQRALAFFTPTGDRSADVVLAPLLAGVTLSAVEALAKTAAHRKQPLTPDGLARMKKELVEKDCNGLIEFIEPRRTLDDVHGQDAVKAWLRQDVALWHRGDLKALPMGYLLCGPVGTGKTFLVECLAGEAGVPVVKLKNFRDRWVGSTEGNLEKIFRLLHGLGRCVVFVDEADQSLGRRTTGDDSGISGRVYSMLAAEMGDPANRGRIVWVLASSRPDLIEVDLKRPGRIDVKIPLFPTATPAEGFRLIRALCGKLGVAIEEDTATEFAPLVPPLLTPGAAETLAIKVYRHVRTRSLAPADALRQCLTGYQNPVPREVLDFQIQLAVREASDLDFVPPAFREQ